ncbi:hypothetical protein AGDE_13657 [Angomonas deanei]|uniref:Sugar phosphate phosphatase n=1 Tax=Angomonas deanei TaxID=59799 RepID=A0A7G2CJM8_9TRYP|nr:hypothetical protein AGDE_13657 [Angomonas deanei]CAD2220060.1 Protein of unknown function DUF89, putative [Angomonas deanei]|eukprot:EPY21930.1 hypothetical protein AGDE_13657 [Angomonas deanei]
MHHSEAELEKAKASLDPSKTETFAINTVSPYAMDHPFESQETLLEKGAVGTDGFVVAPAAPHQTVASTESIFTKPLLNRDGIEIQWQHNGASKDTVAMERIPLESILPPAKNNLIPVTDKQTVAPHFTPYQDIFRYEKVEVTSHFIQTRHLTKMIVCAPWEMHYTDPANEQFARTLCSWLLWGNGVDSSMFSPEELRQRLKEQNKKGEKEDGGKQQSGITVEDLRNICRQDEITLNEKKNANVIQNDIPGIVAYLVKHFEKVHASKDGHLVNKIDIVMDNTGVESVADLCFALWFLQNADHPVTKPKVVFHVKPMPYYISDVTPRDFELVFSLLRQEMEKLSATTGESEEERQYNTFIKDQLARFITLAEGYLANGQMVIDADIVWTMPCEVRELPPRIINAYFYTQHIHKHATPEENLRSEVSIFNESSPITSLHQCNKDVIIPKSVLVVFKGDLNYRRVLGDRHWNRIDFNTSNVYSHDDNTESLLHYTFLQDELFQDTPEADDATDPAPGTAVFRNSLSSIVGRYWPIREVPVVTVRTMKSEVSAGVPQAVKLAEDSRQGANPTWRTNGQYGVILLAH